MQPAGATFMPVPNRPEYLVSARFVPPESIDLQFADRRFTLNIGLLGMPVDRINWSTAKASPAGEAMTVRGVRKDEIPIDSSTIRYLVDSNYAAKMDATLKSLQFSREELQQMSRDNPPPATLLDEPGGDDLIGDSWK